MRRAYCFDLDGTLTAEEILPRLARDIGLFEEIATLTRATMDGLLPFENSFRLRVRLLAEVPISKVRRIIGQVPLDPRLLAFIHANLDDCYVVTGNLDVWVDGLRERLKCRVFSSEADWDGDRVLGVRKIINKSVAIRELADEYDEIVAVGDGMNDSPLFEAADVCVAYGGIHDPVETLIKMADFVTYHPEGLLNILSTLRSA
ncbi:MAG: HAD family phosphatase [Gammaproteobacteria bacterium]|nr:HAD family phosphatase [Gammaproteobacteria bacterium]